MNNPCAFCEESLATQEVVRSRLTKVIYPRRPVVEAAVMVMPVRHCEHITDLTSDEQVDMFLIIKKLEQVFKVVYNIEGFNLFANNGVVAGQHVPHVHFHFFGRSAAEAVSPFAVLNNKELFDRLEKLTPEMIRERADRIKAEFDLL